MKTISETVNSVVTVCGNCSVPFKVGDEVLQVITGKVTDNVRLNVDEEDKEFMIENGIIYEIHVRCSV